MADLSMPMEGPSPDDRRWTAWSPDDIHTRLSEAKVPWCIAAGWALELFRGEVIRSHADLEIAVPAARFPVVREALIELEFEVVGGGQSWPIDSPAYDHTHQTWGRERSTGLYRLDVIREPHSGDRIFRRDHRIRLPYSSVIRHSADGIPFMAPEIVLLFKAKHCREKDQADFTGTLPLMNALSRSWLAEVLGLVHPRHPWLALVSQ